MIKKLLQMISVIALVLFSFYYTDKTINLIRQTDPLMKQIKEESKEKEIEAMDAKTDGNKIKSGKNGQTVDIDKTYQKMKQYGAYNEMLTVFKETTPNISIEDTYDKFVIGGNEENREVALLFPIENQSNPEEIIRIINQENIPATFFLDGLWLENNLATVKSIKNHELEILNYNHRYEEIYFQSAIQYLKNITGNAAQYCYADYDNKEVIELCSKLKLHTVTPTIKITNSPFQEIKDKLQNGAIISLPINSIVEEELPTIINYIKSRGYQLVTLQTLLSEEYEK